jgi:hypothetical protein
MRITPHDANNTPSTDFSHLFLFIAALDGVGLVLQGRSQPKQQPAGSIVVGAAGSMFVCVTLLLVVSETFHSATGVDP